MKVLVFCVLLVLCFQTFRCQETEGGEEEGPSGGGGQSLWDRMKNAWKGMVNSIQKMWNDFKEEMKARATDMKDYSKEMVDAIRKKMNEIIDSMKDASPAEKEDMKKFVENLQRENASMDFLLES